jgi:hypothetical protein
MVLSGNLYKGMQTLGGKVRHAVKYTWASGYQQEKVSKGSWGTDLGYRFK